MRDPSKLRRMAYGLLGTLSLALGLIGIVVPLLPTTPFLLLTAWCYLRFSNRAYRRLMSNPYLGPYIRNYREYRCIPLKAKLVSLILLWATISSSAYFWVDRCWVRILLLAIALGVTFHITSFQSHPTKPRTPSPED